MRTARPPRRQRGAALLTAMIIVTLVATLAAAMVWQQWRAVQVEAAERARAQAAWILSGALDFGRMILREDARGGKPTALTEPWATPLAESRLSTFLAVDKSNVDDSLEAFLSGDIADAQGRFNLTNLVDQGKVNTTELAVLVRLCQSVSVDSSVATLIASRLVDATGTSATAPLKPDRVAQLTWFGIDEATVRALAPYVVLLPTATPINVNTASTEVLAAAVDGLDNATAQHIAQVRQRTPFKTIAEFNAQLPTPPNPAASAAAIDIRSNYFEVRARLRLADRVLVERSLVQRQPGLKTAVIDRERVASLETADSK